MTATLKHAAGVPGPVGAEHTHSYPDERGPDSRVDLCGLDYHERRRRLFTVLRALRPGQVLRLDSDRADDVYWLRYEAEARMSARYCWSLPSRVPGGRAGAVETTVRRPDRLP